jgi:hypothetical protein
MLATLLLCLLPLWSSCAVRYAKTPGDITYLSIHLLQKQDIGHIQYKEFIVSKYANAPDAAATKALAEGVISGVRP